MELESQGSGQGRHEQSQASTTSGHEHWPALSQASHASLDGCRPMFSQGSHVSPARPASTRASGVSRASSHWSIRSDGSRRSGMTIFSAIAHDVLYPENHTRSLCLICRSREATRLAVLLVRAWCNRCTLQSSRCWLNRASPTTAELSPRLWAVLHPYQREGVRWLFRAHFAGGGILGDEPGLGTTLQAVAVMHALVTAKLVARVLLVVTAEMLATWAGEFKKFLPARSVELVAIQRELPGLHATDHLRRLVSIDSPNHCIVLISYEGLHAHGHVLHGTEGVDLVVADEAHRLRNLGRMAASFARVPLRARRGASLLSSRLLLTGTPLPNNVEEFVRLADLAVPGILGGNAVEEMSKPITVGTAPGASLPEREEAAVVSAYLADVTRQVMLRRTNSDLERGLPVKHSFLLMVRPTRLQRKIHLSLQEAVAGSAFTRLQMLRSNLIHPETLLTTSAGISVVRAEVTKFPEQPWGRLSCSGKLQAAARMLDYILDHTGDKAVVVSSSLSALALLGAYVRHKLGKDECTFSLVGSTPKSSREKHKKLFNSASNTDLRVLLLVDKLAEGQTLTGANHLILVDPTWNPALDMQSLGRIHRPGQTKTCYLYRLLITGTIDETIVERQAGKVELLHMLSSKRLPAPLLDDRHLLFSLDDEDTPSRLATHLDELPGLCYSSSSWQKIDLTDRECVEALEPFHVVHDLAQHVLMDPDVGVERLALVAPKSGEAIAAEANAADDVRYILSYVFHSRSDAMAQDEPEV